MSTSRQTVQNVADTAEQPSGKPAGSTGDNLLSSKKTMELRMTRARRPPAYTEPSQHLWSRKRKLADRAPMTKRM